MLNSRAILSVALVALAACTSKQDHRELVERVQELEAKAEAAETARAALASRLEVHGNLADLRLSALEQGSDAIVSAESSNYGIARTSHGPVTVSIISATPYIDGYKLRLRIGNLTSAHFQGATIVAKWAQPGGLTRTSLLSPEPQGEKEFPVTTSFPPGAFSNAEIVVAPAKPEDIRHVSVAVKFDQIAMRKPGQ